MPDETIDATLAGPEGPGRLLGRPAAGYLDEAAVALAAVKREVLRRLALRPGQRALDAGCGTGADALEMARRVGAEGSVVGVDISPNEVEEARGRARDTGLPVDFRLADIQDLPFPDGSFDACRAERMLQHVPDPERGVTELLRVARPGGRVVVADPDHGMWAPDLTDIESVRAVLTWWFGHVRHPWAGRRLPGLLERAGAREVRAEVMPVTLSGAAAVQGLTGLLGALRPAQEQGVITAAQARAIDEDIAARENEGRLRMFGVVIVAEGRKAGR